MRKGAAASRVRSNTGDVQKPSGLNCLDAICPSRVRLPQNPKARKRSPCQKPLYKVDISPTFGQEGAWRAIRSG